MRETGCGAVKLEGGARMAETIRFLTQRGIPVMGHVGLTPQSIATLGSFRAQGRDRDSWPAMIEDASAVAQAGAFAIVVEAVAEPLAVAMTKAVPVPTIGIGGSAQCDGQILVLEDMLGLGERAPKFVRRYAEIGQVIEKAVAEYAADVRARSFPRPGKRLSGAQGRGVIATRFRVQAALRHKSVSPWAHACARRRARVSTCARCASEDGV